MSKFYWQRKWSNTVSLCKKTHRNAISNKKNRSWAFQRHCLTWFRKQGHFAAGQLRNPWQTLAEPLGSAEPRLKNTDIGRQCDFITLMFLCVFYIYYGYVRWRHHPVNMASRFLHHFRRSSISNVIFFMLTKRWVLILLSKFSENCALLGKW